MKRIGMAVLFLAVSLMGQETKAPVLADADKAKIAMLQRKQLQLASSMLQMQAEFQREQQQSQGLAKQVDEAISTATKSWGPNWKLNPDTLEALPAPKAPAK